MRVVTVHTAVAVLLELLLSRNADVVDVHQLRLHCVHVSLLSPWRCVGRTRRRVLCCSVVRLRFRSVRVAIRRCL